LLQNSTKIFPKFQQNRFKFNNCGKYDNLKNFERREMCILFLEISEIAKFSDFIRGKSDNFIF
jgi:hypothetical protein